MASEDKNCCVDIAELFDEIIERASELKGGVNVTPLTVTENGTYNPEKPYKGFAPVEVNVPDTTPVLDELTVTENGTYTPDTGTDGFSEVEVNVPQTYYAAKPKGNIIETPYTINESGEYETVAMNGTADNPSRVEVYNPIIVDIDNNRIKNASIITPISSNPLMYTYRLPYDDNDTLTNWLENGIINLTICPELIVGSTYENVNSAYYEIGFVYDPSGEFISTPTVINVLATPGKHGVVTVLYNTGTYEKGVNYGLFASFNIPVKPLWQNKDLDYMIDQILVFSNLYVLIIPRNTNGAALNSGTAICVEGLRDG